MDSLPLFPLPVVLFPSVGIPLHVFEPRYRQMVTHVLSGDRRFGLIYHDPDESGPFLNEGGQVGTVALVEKHQPLPDGRSLILVRGLERFRILQEVSGEALYYQARTEPYLDDEVREEEALKARRKKSLDLFNTVLESLPHVPEALPSLDLENELSFKLAAMARMDPPAQQELLEMRSEWARLDSLDPVFRHSVRRWGQWGGPEA